MPPPTPPRNPRDDFMAAVGNVVTHLPPMVDGLVEAWTKGKRLFKVNEGDRDGPKSDDNSMVTDTRDTRDRDSLKQDDNSKAIGTIGRGGPKQDDNSKATPTRDRGSPKQDDNSKAYSTRDRGSPNEDDDKMDIDTRTVLRHSMNSRDYLSMTYQLVLLP